MIRSIPWTAAATVVAMLTVAATPARAQVQGRVPPALAPTAASQLVILEGDPSPTQCPGGNDFRREFSRRLLSDGTAQPFSMPPDQVLVVTGVNFEILNGEGLTRTVQLELARPPNASTNTVFIWAAPPGRTALVLPLSGIAAGPGTVLCLYSSFSSGGVSGNVSGFLAPNR